MSIPTPSIPGVDRDALAYAICDAWWTKVKSTTNQWDVFADVALIHIAAHHECACDRAHDDEWVEVDESTWDDLPDGARRRLEWLSGGLATARRFVHRDDMPDAARENNQKEN